MDVPLVSVILPVFRANKDQLSIALYSMINQTYKNIEILILYEGDKNDDSYKFLKNVSDKRVVVFEEPNKSGLPKSLNDGIRFSRGKYIARMDSDDYSDPQRISKQVNYLEKHENIAVVGTVCKDINSKHLRFSTFIKPDVRKVRMMFYNAGVAHPTAMIRKSFLLDNNIRYNESIRGSEDYHLWSDIVIADGNITVIHEILHYYRVHKNQASQVLSNEQIEWNNTARIKNLSVYSKVEEDESICFNRWCEDLEIIEINKIQDIAKKVIRGCNDKKRALLMQKEFNFQLSKRGVKIIHSINRISEVQEGIFNNSIVYCIEQYMDAILGKVIPYLKLLLCIKRIPSKNYLQRGTI